jgi:hypothetical protein
MTDNAPSLTATLALVEAQRDREMTADARIRALRGESEPTPEEESDEPST